MAKKSTGKRATLDTRKIVKCKEDIKLSNTTLSKISGGLISEPQVSKILNGAIKNPRIDTACALAKALGVTLNDIITFK